MRLWDKRKSCIYSAVFKSSKKKLTNKYFWLFVFHQKLFLKERSTSISIHSQYLNSFSYSFSCLNMRIFILIFQFSNLLSKESRIHKEQKLWDFTFWKETPQTPTSEGCMQQGEKTVHVLQLGQHSSDTLLYAWCPGVWFLYHMNATHNTPVAFWFCYLKNTCYSLPKISRTGDFNL